jgi:hypothetical protein
LAAQEKEDKAMVKQWEKPKKNQRASFYQERGSTNRWHRKSRTLSSIGFSFAKQSKKGEEA